MECAEFLPRPHDANAIHTLNVVCAITPVSVNLSVPYVAVFCRNN